MHIIVLGGAGAMGRVTVRTLTEYEDVDQITIADYNEARARELAAALHSSKISCSTDRCERRGAFAHSLARLRRRSQCR